MAINIIDAFTQSPPVLDFVLPGFLAGTVGILTSAGGVGKSFWTLEAAMSIASPLTDPLQLQIANHGCVCILNAEDQAAVLINRLHAIGRLLSKEARESLVQNYILEDLYGRGVDIMESKWQDAIIEMAGRNKARLVVLDTLSRWHRLDENSNADMGRLMSVLDSIASQTSASILLLHHVSKDMAKDGRQDEQQSARGASLLVDNARWQAFMCVMTRKEAESFGVASDMRKRFVRFGISKQNSGVPFGDVWYQRVDGGVLIPAVLDKNHSDNNRRDSNV
jgi:hypothetical protein